jgi:hypothetical protein
MEIPPAVGQIISIVLMASTIVSSAMIVLKRKISFSLIGIALLIATVSNLLGKLFVSMLHLPGWISYTVPTIAFVILSHYFFRPSFRKLIVYWLVGFAFYLIVHVLISFFFDWTFMFPFWPVHR